METTILAAGCFWGVEEYFRKLPGVMETTAGYIGGELKNPTYQQVCSERTGHAEAIEVKFDPSKITFEKLLYVFFKLHDPTTLNRQGNDRGTQYRSAIFYTTIEQKEKAENFIHKVDSSGAWGDSVTTTIEPGINFYPAEKYHQKYLINNPGGYCNHRMRNLDFGK